jgi:hypothetical protein
VLDYDAANRIDYSDKAAVIKNMLNLKNDQELIEQINHPEYLNTLNLQFPNQNQSHNLLQSNTLPSNLNLEEEGKESSNILKEPKTPPSVGSVRSNTQRPKSGGYSEEAKQPKNELVEKNDIFATVIDSLRHSFSDAEQVTQTILSFIMLLFLITNIFINLNFISYL